MRRQHLTIFFIFILAHGLHKLCAHHSHGTYQPHLHQHNTIVSINMIQVSDLATCHRARQQAASTHDSTIGASTSPSSSSAFLLMVYTSYAPTTVMAHINHTSTNIIQVSGSSNMPSCPLPTSIGNINTRQHHSYGSKLLTLTREL